MADDEGSGARAGSADGGTGAEAGGTGPSPGPGSGDMDRRKRRTLAVLVGVAVVLAFLPLAVSLGLFGGAESPPARVGFLPFQAPPAQMALAEAANALVEGTHARFREEDDPRLALIGPSETRRFRESTEAPEVLGRRIGADVVLAGGLRPTDDGQVQLSAAVVRVEDGRSLWTGEMKVADPSRASTRSFLTEWLWDRARRTVQTVRAEEE